MRVVVGISGGVDSSVAAHLLLEEGHEVIGVFMKNWDSQVGLLSGDCPWLQDSEDAVKVASQLGIPLHIVDFVQEYAAEVVDYLFAEYAAGRTPNPDILCNREIKFKHFYDVALRFGAEKVATGHYARVLQKAGVYGLYKGLDASKDQSYFLCQLSQEQLSRALFPIGDYQKTEIREIASRLGLVTAAKKDSQGICFVGKVNLPEFLQQKLAATTGNIFKIPQTIDLSAQQNSYDAYDLSVFAQQKVGEHTGAAFYTIGQRKGLRVGGSAEPLFVLGTDIVNNLVYVGEGTDHPALFRRKLWINTESLSVLNPILWNKALLEPGLLFAKIRYRQADQAVRVVLQADKLLVDFVEPQRAVTAGQFAAFYFADELVASGVIW